MYKHLITFLKSYKKATITLGELENLVLGDISYNKFAESVRQLVADNILVEKNQRLIYDNIITSMFVTNMTFKL